MIQLTLIACAVASVLIGILLLVQNIRKPVNLLAAGINFSIALWSVNIVFFMDATLSTSAETFAQLYYIAAAVFPALLVLFSSVFPDQRHLSLTKTFVALVASSVVILSIIFVPNFLIGDTVIDQDGNYIVVDVLTYLLYSAYFVAFFVYGLVLIAQKYMATKKNLRSQTGAYLIGVLSMSIPGFITNLILPFFQDYRFIWVGPAMSVVFLSALAYSIVRHGMFDIRLAVVRSVVYIFSLVTLGAIYVFAAFVVSEYMLGRPFSLGVSWMYIILSLLLIFLFLPIKGFFDRVTKKTFFRDNYEQDDFIARLTRILASTSDLKALILKASNEIADTLQAEQVFFYVYQEDRFITSGTRNHKKLPISDARRLDDLIGSDSKTVVTGLLGHDSELRRLLRSHWVALTLPLVREGRIIGYVMLGEHKGRGYTSRDLHVLETISDELVIAVQNATSVHEVREINATLQQRIDMATEELRHSNAELQRLDAAKDEFVSMASHQLRTPLTSVKGYISMVLEGDAGEISDMQKKLLHEAFTSSERMVHLINDFLNISRLQTGRFIIDRRLTDVAKMMHQEVDSLRTTATSRDLKLQFSMPKNVPKLYVDEGKLRQVVMNFIDNAIFYSKPDSTIKVKFVVEDDILKVTVKDTGIGVPSGEQSHLFKKFFRASNARKQRPDGTGVGLYLAKRIITEHGGRIIFDSIEGKGSTFGFELPIKKLSLAPVDNSDQLDK